MQKKTTKSNNNYLYIREYDFENVNNVIKILMYLRFPRYQYIDAKICVEIDVCML